MRHRTVLSRLGSLLRSAALIGPGNSVRAIAYAIHRSRLDAHLSGRHGARQIGLPPSPARDTLRVRPGQLPHDQREPGRVEAAEACPGGARFAFTHARLEIRLLQAGGAFVAWDGAEALPSYALTGGLDGETPDWHELARLSTVGDGWQVEAGDHSVVVGPSGQLSFFDAGQSRDPVRVDEPPQWSGAAAWTHRGRLETGAVVLGLGGRAAGLDRRPGTYRLWNTDVGGSYERGDDPLSMCLPVALVTSAAGTHLAFFDNSFEGSVEVDEAMTFRLSGGPLRYYVFPGTPDQALDRYTALTGRPALLPRWAYGFHQSRWEYGSQAAMEAMVGEFDRHDLPLSGVWLDIDHLDRRRVFTVDPRRYPGLGRFADELAKDDRHLVAIVDPAIPRRRTFPIYTDGLAADAFCRDARGRVAWGVVWPGVTVYPDFTAPRAREWWGRLHDGYLGLGVDGFWNDMNEPSAFAAAGDATLPLSTRHDLDGRGGDHVEGHNVYGLGMNHATFEAVRSRRPDRRPFLITRAGWLGVQRYAGTWTGDIASTWDNLAVSLSFTIGLGASGVPFSGPDVGGFHGHPSAELFVRWFELGAYLPFFRTHCAKNAPPREPWAYGPDVLERLRGVLKERYGLLPYWYTLGWQAHRTGRPYVRPMLWADPQDPALRGVEDQFMLGDALIVAPVLHEGVRERLVRLPRGRWYERRTGTAYDGPAAVTVGAALGEVPVFVRAGAVLPVTERGDGATRTVVLEAYPPAPGTTGGGVLISDSGDGYADPVEERFATSLDASGHPVLTPADPRAELPYSVRWRGAGRPEPSAGGR
jgi:alpha-glucosidase